MSQLKKIRRTLLWGEGDWLVGLYIKNPSVNLGRDK